VPLDLKVRATFPPGPSQLDFVETKYVGLDFALTDDDIGGDHGSLPDQLISEMPMDII
jgi:hypothetical protein